MPARADDMKSHLQSLRSPSSCERPSDHVFNPLVLLPGRKREGQCHGRPMRKDGCCWQRLPLLGDNTQPNQVEGSSTSLQQGESASSIRLYAWDDRDIGPPVPGRESSKWIEYVIAGTFAARRRPKRLKVRLHIIGSGWHKLKIPRTLTRGISARLTPPTFLVRHSSITTNPRCRGTM